MSAGGAAALPMPPGDPEGVTSLIAYLSRVAADLAAVSAGSDRVHSGLASSWRGTAADAATAKAAQFVAIAGECPPVLAPAVVALRSWVVELTSARHRITGLQQSWDQADAVPSAPARQAMQTRLAGDYRLIVTDLSAAAGVATAAVRQAADRFGGGLDRW